MRFSCEPLMTKSQNNNDNNEQPTPSKPKPARRGWIFILIALAFIAFIVIRDARRSIDWAGDYQDAVQQARQTHKPLLLVFVKTGDSNCERMKNATYVNDRIIKYINRNFVPVMLDVEQNSDLAEQYKISQYPNHVITIPDRKEFHTVPGYVITGEFIGRLKRALEKLNPKKN